MSDEITPTTSISTTSGGVNVAGDQIAIGGDVVGRDKIVQGYTAGEVRALLDQISTTFQPRPFDGRCPYLGLASYDEDTADLFFGRERIVTELTDRVREARWVFVTGPSGSGKSSLVRAGLIYGLKHNAVPDSERWLYEALKPGRDPLTELARVASSLAGTLNAGEDIRTKGQTDPTILHQWVEIALKDKRDRRAVILVDQFEETFTQVAREAERVASSLAGTLNAGEDIRTKGQTDPTILHQWADIALKDKRDRRAVILVDQFEETFTQVAREAERVAFLNLLTYAATAEGGRVTLVFAMRSDFVSNCAAYPQLNDLLNQQFMQIGVMTPAELVSAIAQPALRVGLKVEPELVTQIIADMKGEPGALPLVQFALRDLFEAQQAQGGVNALTLHDYLARGGIHKALERHADSVFAQLSEPEQSIAHAVFGGLIQVGRGAEDTRRTALFDELVPADVAPSQVEVVVGKLADARLIITDERDGRDIVTIAHEKLIDAWPWLRKLVNENRDSIALQNQIAEDAGEWEKNQRDASYLYIGARLANAREQLAAKKIKLNGLAQAFVTAGVEAEGANRAREAARIQKELDDARRIVQAERRAKQNLRLLVAGLSVLLLGASWLLLIQPLLLRLRARGETVVVAAGEFAPGAAEEVNVPQERQAETWRASVDEFRIEQYEVTNAQYRLCVQDRACSEPANLVFYDGDDKADLPVVAITLKQAADYCQWIGRRLPTEIEWEWAARRAENWKYPTGSEEPASRAINANTYNPNAPVGTDFRQPVDALKADRGGTSGMAGNVQEWTVSFFLAYDDPAYRISEWQRGTPSSEFPAEHVVARGGSFIERIERARSIARHPIRPAFSDDVVGFRCVEGGS